MSKIIKFNLDIDNNSIRTTEDLRNNFVIEDVLELHNNGMLKKWLNVRGFHEYLKKVEEICETSDIEVINQLVNIFQVELPSRKLEELTEILRYKKQKQALLEQYENVGFNANRIINDYHKGYKTVINHIVENKNNMSQIKASVKAVAEDYINLFLLNSNNIYNKLVESAPMAIYAFLMNSRLRDSFLCDKHIIAHICAYFTVDGAFVLEQYKSNNLREVNIKKHEEDTNNRWKLITKEKVLILNANYDRGYLKVKDRNGTQYTGVDVIGKILDGLSFSSYYSDEFVEYIEYENINMKLKSALGDELKVFCGVTDSYWKDLEPSSKKCMILSIEPGSFVRNQGKREIEYKSEDINGKFLILDGIDYKSNNSLSELLYVEV